MREIVIKKSNKLFPIFIAKLLVYNGRLAVIYSSTVTKKQKMWESYSNTNAELHIMNLSLSLSYHTPCHQGKVLFQEATQMKLAWDDNVPTCLCNKWAPWLCSLTYLEKLNFSQCILPHDFADGVFELHHFCDASTIAYDACSYLSVINRDSRVFVTLHAAKGHLAPLK